MDTLNCQIDCLSSGEIFGFISISFDLFLTDDDAIFGKSGGVGEFVAEFFVGKYDSGFVTFCLELR